MTSKEITPDDSVAPVFLSKEPIVPMSTPPGDAIRDAEEVRASALAKIAALGGLTEQEVFALVGE